MPYGVRLFSYETNLEKINEMYPTLSFEDIDYDMNQEEVSKWNIGDTLPVGNYSG